MPSPNQTAAPVAVAENPFFQSWDAPYGLAPFEQIKPADFPTAFSRAMEEHNAEIAAIVDNPAPATFDNVICALERAGAAMRRVGSVFWNISGTDTNAELQAIERDIAPKLAAHYSAIGLSQKLFARVEAVYAQRDNLGLNAEQARVLELTYDSFIRSGVRLAPAQKERYSQIAERLATLGAQFSQNVLADEAAWAMILEEGDLDGLPQSLRDSAAQTARARGHDGKWAITLGRSSIEPFLTYSNRRDLREKAFLAWTQRGETGGDTDNRAIITEIIALRDESATLLGFANYAEFKLANQMAKSPARVRALLDSVWAPAKAQAARERAMLQDIAAKSGENFDIAAHDWRFYAEIARKAQFDLDEAEIRPYFSLDNVIEAAFSVANRLFGLRFTRVEGLKLYHPEVRAYDVRDAKGAPVALFLGDYFARPSKRSGAWMSAFRTQSNLDAPVRPIITNVLNFAKAGEGQPTLIGLQDARTLFHEFGHALHGMLSDVTYPSIAGTGVARDFVEFPSQLYEHWLLQPEVLASFAKHADTGAPIPEDLAARIQAARNFNQGFDTVEFLSSAFVDLDLHEAKPTEGFDVMAFEASVLARLGMPKEIVMRHRSPHFSHVFSGPGYASGYYSYLWSAVLDTDGFAAFEEKADIFDEAVAQKLKQFVYSAGGREAPDDAYRKFRGRDPDPQALLRYRGFV